VGGFVSFLLWLYLEEHGTDKVHALEEFEVDVHVVRGLPPSLSVLLLRVLLGVFVRVTLDPLREQLLHTALGLNFHQARVGFVDHAVAECAQAELRHHAVKQNLRANV
jgi:hypothetical protein